MRAWKVAGMSFLLLLTGCWKPTPGREHVKAELFVAQGATEKASRRTPSSHFRKWTVDSYNVSYLPRGIHFHVRDFYQNSGGHFVLMYEVGVKSGLPVGTYKFDATWHLDADNDDSLDEWLDWMDPTEQRPDTLYITFHIRIDVVPSQGS